MCVCVGGEYTTFNIFLYTEPTLTVIGNLFCKPLILKIRFKPVYETKGEGGRVNIFCEWGKYPYKSPLDTPLERKVSQQIDIRIRENYIHMLS